MDLVLRAAILYIFILLILRLSGKRVMAELTTFDFVLLMVIAESTDNSIIAQDNSLTSTIIVIITFVGLDLLLAGFKQKWRWFDRWSEGTPLIIVEQGKFLNSRAAKEKVDLDDVLTAARRLQGLERLAQIKYAILEKSGGITIVPVESRR